VQTKLFKDLPKTKNFHIYNNPSHNKCKLYLAKQIETLTAQILRILLRKQKFPFSFFVPLSPACCSVLLAFSHLWERISTEKVVRFVFLAGDPVANRRMGSEACRLF
jgi:hypothetical protein